MAGCAVLYHFSSFKIIGETLRRCRRAQIGFLLHARPVSFRGRLPSPNLGPKRWNGQPLLARENVRHRPVKTTVEVLSWTGLSQGKWPSRQTGLVSKATIIRGLHLGRSGVLRSLRHFLQTQNQGHHIINHLEERGVERGSTWRPFVWKDKKELWSVRPTSGLFQGQRLCKYLRNRVEHMWVFLRAQIPSWTELNILHVDNSLTWACPVLQHKELPVEQTTDCLSTMANICRLMIENPWVLPLDPSLTIRLTEYYGGHSQVNLSCHDCHERYHLVSL